MLLGSGEDAGTGPGALSKIVAFGLVVCARDMRPPSKTPGGRRQDCPARGRAGGASHVSSRHRVHRQPAIALVASAACLSSSMGAEWFVALPTVASLSERGPVAPPKTRGPRTRAWARARRSLPPAGTAVEGVEPTRINPEVVVALDVRAAPTPGGLVGGGWNRPALPWPRDEGAGTLALGNRGWAPRARTILRGSAPP
jgi:hypothetical protein